MKLGKVRYNYVLYLFVSYWYYYICILSKSSRAEVFLKKVFLKILQNLQENICTEVSFSSAASNFINEKTLTQCFPKPSTIFAKISIVIVWLVYKYASVLLPDLKQIYKEFLLRKSKIKIVAVLHYHHRFISQGMKLNNTATLVK